MTASHKRGTRVNTGGGGGGSRQQQRRGAQAAGLNEIIEHALTASQAKSRGINKKDRRFRWHVLRNSQGSACELPLADSADVTQAPVTGQGDTVVGARQEERSISSGQDEAGADETVDTTSGVDGSDVSQQESARPPPDAADGARFAVPDLIAALFHDGGLPRALIASVQECVEARVGAKACIIVSGSTGSRITAMAAGASPSLVTKAFPISDLDVEVSVPPSTRQGAIAEDIIKKAALEGIEAACSHIVGDTGLVDRVSQKLELFNLTNKGMRMNSRIYRRNTKGALVSIDVPRFSPGGDRLQHSPIFATRNDTLPDGLVLHRIRIACCENGGEAVRRTSVPIMDIKTQVRTPTQLVKRMEWGLKISVPTPAAAVNELQRMLEREYDNVDASKDERRVAQRALLATLDRRGRRTKS